MKTKEESAVCSPPHPSGPLMLPRQTVPASLAELLAVFRPHLTAPSYRTFCALACGLITAGGRRTVTGMLIGAGLAGRWHHSRAHHLFVRARWCPDRLAPPRWGLLGARVPARASRSRWCSMTPCSAAG